MKAQRPGILAKEAVAWCCAGLKSDQCLSFLFLLGLSAHDFSVSEQNDPAGRLSRFCKILTMVEPVRILTVERDDEDGLFVTFSDGTTAGYVTEELLELRPFREPTGEALKD